MTVTVRALQPNGLLYYMGSSSTTDYFAVFMVDGYIETRMKRNSDASTIIERRTKRRFDDGNWWKVTVLCIYLFIYLFILYFLYLSFLNC